MRKFPPEPPSSLWGVGEGECEGLVNLVRRNRKRSLACATPQRRPPPSSRSQQPEGTQGRGDEIRRGVGGRLRREGKHWKGKLRKRRADLPLAPKSNSSQKGKQKWKTAIKTAKLFKLNQSKGENVVKDFKLHYYANSSRKAKASVRKTVEGILDGLGAWGKPCCWSPETLEQVGAVLKESKYKAGHAYLSEYKQLLIEKGTPWSHQLQRVFAQVTRALKRAQGPAKKAAEVPEALWMEKCRSEINEQMVGTIHYPALMFAFATTWMLREVELAAIYKEDITIEEKDRIVALHLRITKGDQEGQGIKRTLQCCCGDVCDWSSPCPFMITKAALDSVPIEEDMLVHGDTTDGPDRELVEGFVRQVCHWPLWEKIRRPTIHPTRLASSPSRLPGEMEVEYHLTVCRGGLGDDACHGQPQQAEGAELHTTRTEQATLQRKDSRIREEAQAGDRSPEEGPREVR